MGSDECDVDGRPNERPQHDVRVPSFYLGEYPVTQLQWLAVMGNMPRLDSGFRDDAFPIVNVWLEDALDFCDRASRQAGFVIRLPAEAEWEYACRAGTQTPYYWGGQITSEQVNFRDPNAETKAGLKPVGFSGKANAFGLFDMHGNVWEWCADKWHDDYEGAPIDGSAWLADGDAGYQVQRGGSWADPATVCRSAFRVGDVARNSDHIVGLRVGLTAW